VTRLAVCAPHFVLYPVLADLCDELRRRYDEVVFSDCVPALRGDDLIAFLKGCDKAITALEVLDESVFAAVPEMRVVGKVGVGLDMIDLKAMARHGVKLGWEGGINKRAVSEITLQFILAILKNVPLASKELLDGVWRRQTGRQLTGKTVGIIGCGNIGKDLTLLLKPFGCTILAHDILDYPDFYQEHCVEPVGMEDLLRRSDIVTLHVPKDDSTLNILSAERLALMQPRAVLVNAARGGLIDESALEAMLRDGRLAAAALDVFAVEPPPNRSILELANFFGTPHMAGSTEEALRILGESAVQLLETPRLPDAQWPAGG
jgi:phosphoglycerate dehydrogenase-like enzyme